MTNKTVAVVGIGFAPKKSPEQEPQHNPEAVKPTSTPETAPITPDTVQAEVGQIASHKTVAVVGIGFAPSRSK